MLEHIPLLKHLYPEHNIDEVIEKVIFKSSR